jgi:hypothetical protein
MWFLIQISHLSFYFLSFFLELVKQSLVALLEISIDNKKVQENVMNGEFIEQLCYLAKRSTDDGLTYAVVWMTCEIAKSKCWASFSFFLSFPHISFSISPNNRQEDPQAVDFEGHAFSA